MNPLTHPSSALPRAFAHPLWWLALALLLLNDHLFKGSHALPPVFTGKLSDIAGMLVAPPLVALLLGAARARARLLATLLVGGGFALIKLVPALAHVAEQLFSLLGVHSRIWLDASDLLALLALPLGHALCKPTTKSALRAGRPLRWTQRAGIALAAFACVATTGVGKKGDSGKRGDAPAVKNASSAKLSLIVASTEGAGGCSLYRDDRVSLLTADAFHAARVLTLDADAQAALPLDTATASCGAASVGLPDGQQATVFWRSLDDLPSFVPADDARRKARLITITGKPGSFKLAIGGDLASFDLGGKAPSSTCDQPTPQYSLEATPLAMAQGFLELSEVRHDQDQCLVVDWFMGQGQTNPDTQRLCIPDWAFPFDPGERLSVTQELGALGARTLRITRFSGSSIRTQLAIWSDSHDFPDSSVKSLAPGDCIGALSECGAYVRSVAVSVRNKSAPLHPGDETTLKGDRPKTTRLLVGPGRDVAWTSASCQGVEARLGPSVSVLELRTY
jgi:hypothetical protein